MFEWSSLISTSISVDIYMPTTAVNNNYSNIIYNIILICDKH